MSDSIVDPAGGAGGDELKPPAAPGLEAVIDNPEGFLRKKNELESEVKTLKTKLSAYEKAEAQKREQEAKDRGEYQKLLDQREKENQILIKQNKEYRIAAAATVKGLIDPDYVRIIADQVSDDFANLDEVLDGLKTKKSYLFGQTAAPFEPPPDTDKSKAPANRQVKIWTDAEIAALSKEDFEKYKKEIISQQMKGFQDSLKV